MTPMEDVIHSVADDSVPIMVKGKRTKRQQRLSPFASSPSTSSGSVTEENEEEDMAMANCLILLAQGPQLDTTAKKDDNHNNNNNNNNKISSRRFTETATSTDGKAGFYVYECKDCKKCFPSFQALGGHRTSHKRKRDASVVAEEDELLKFSINSNNSFPAKPLGLITSSINNNNNNNMSNNNVLSLKMRVHECSICGAEFSSGQALGGHMRRHRPGSVPEVAEVKKEKSLLSLDLNLPAPSEDHRGDGGVFSCANKRPPLLLLSSSAMVDCHY